MLVALADDDEDDRLFFAEIFDELKMLTKLQLFTNGSELLDYLKDSNNILPDIIFLDLNMPIMGGIDALLEIKMDKRLADIYVAIYSTSSAQSDIEETFILGANIYMVKPSSMAQLKCNLQKIIVTSYQYSTSNMDRPNFVLKI